MALPTGTISMSQVNTELGYSSTALISLNDTAVRTLAGKPSGIISMDDLRGKSAEPTLGFSNTNNFSVDIRAADSLTNLCDIQLGFRAGGCAFSPSSNPGSPVTSYTRNAHPTTWRDKGTIAFDALYEMSLTVGSGGIVYSGNQSAFFLIDYNNTAVQSFASGYTGTTSYYDMTNGMRLYVRAGSTTTVASCSINLTINIRRKSNTAESISRNFTAYSALE